MVNEVVPVLFTGKFDLTLREARTELTDILDAGAYALKQPGLELLPVKRDMLRLPTAEADLILDALNLLFAAILAYEGAQWAIKSATDAITLVSHRIDAGRALGVVEALFYGPTRELILIALDRAPIAFYALAQASPDLHIIDRCNHIRYPLTHK
jgi:hypothetical protein